MKDYAEQTRAAHKQRTSAHESQKRHASDLHDMQDVADRAAEDLKTRQKFRRKRAASARTKKNRKPA